MNVFLVEANLTNFIMYDIWFCPNSQYLVWVPLFGNSVLVLAEFHRSPHRLLQGTGMMDFIKKTYMIYEEFQLV